jgi:hypothetical protein
MKQNAARRCAVFERQRRPEEKEGRLFFFMLLRVALKMLPDDVRHPR